MPTLHELIFETAGRWVRAQGQDGSMPSGSNGPNQVEDTPVRNTAHWTLTFCWMYERTGDSRWADAAGRAVDYLLSPAARPMGFTFWCSRPPAFDSCNGVIGQAWVIEALMAASQTLDRPECADLAREVFFIHPFEASKGIWQRVGADGIRLSPDGTFNHQLWFAMASAMLKDKEADSRVMRFMELVGSQPQCYQNGVIFHLPRMGPFPASPRPLLSELTISLKRRLRRRSLYQRSVGYHAFNLYAYAVLNKRFPDHPFWRSQRFQRLLETSKTEGFIRDLENSQHGYPYNPPGVEFALVGEVFGLGGEYSRQWLQRQIEQTYDRETGDLLTGNVPDKATSAARIYEATRLKKTYHLDI